MSWILGAVIADPESDLLRRVREENSDAHSSCAGSGFVILAGRKVITHGFLDLSKHGREITRKPSGGFSESVSANFAAIAGTALISPGGGRRGVPDVETRILSDPRELYRLLLCGDHTETKRGDISNCSSTCSPEDFLSGQFVAVRSVGTDIEVFFDRNSLRSIYLFQSPGAVLFSTHIHRLQRVVGPFEIDYRAFGSHWLAHNQISEGFFVRGVQRVCGDHSVRISTQAGTASVRKKTQVPVLPSAGIDGVPGQILNFLEHCQHPVMLALSGGIDSRYLMSWLNDVRPGDFSAFMFGNENEPEARIVKQLADALLVPVSFIPEIRDSGQLLDDRRLESFVQEHYCTTPISAAARLLNYPAVEEVVPGSLVLDGAFGEFGRTRFYRKIELLRRIRFLRRFSPVDVQRSLSFPRADIFSRDILREMQGGFAEDSERFYTTLMANARDRPEDDMGIMYRRRNFFGFTQAWIDNWCLNAMPFAQDEAICIMRQIPLARRRGGGFFRDEIRRMAPAAAEVSLVKSGISYPFSRSSAAFHSGVRRLRKEKRENLCAIRLRKWVPARERVYDIVHAQALSSFAGYDPGLLHRLLDDVFVKEIDRTDELDWFLSFEFWRQSLDIS